MTRLAKLPFLALLVAGCGSGEAPVAEAPSTPPPDVARAVAAAPTEAAAKPGAAADADAGEIIAQQFAYGATKERNFVGYFAAPSQIIEPLPGIVLVHERWGLDESIRTVARDLAAAGYAVLAVDLFAGRTADDAAAAQELTTVATGDREASLSNIGQAIDYLRAYALAPRVGLVGFGLGGGLALETAVTTPEKVDAVASYYGRLIFDEAALEKLRAPLIGLYAGDDDSIPTRDVQNFRRTLAESDKNAEILIYPDAGHGFADPARPAYDRSAAEEAWGDLLEFLAEALRGSGR